MKHLYFMAVLLFTAHSLYSQVRQAERILKEAKKESRSEYDVKALNPNQIAVKVPYASKLISEFPSELTSLSEISIRSIDLIYTDFPKNNDKFQYFLNKMRILELASFWPDVLSLSPQSWRLVAQTKCSSRQEAGRLFHGFVITVNDLNKVPDFTDLEELSGLSEGDSTILKVIGRHEEWRKMLVVTDLTSSMAPFTAQLLVWFKLNEKRSQVEHFVFFNDGDNIPDEEKAVGKTGGIYSGKAGSFEEVAALATKAVEMGFGGDVPENNMEALLYGLEACPDCEDVIMIADNWATPRDLTLADKVDRPIKIILCGTEQGMNVNYLNIALKTGGSIHTIEEDIYDLMSLNEGEEIKIGKEIFIIKDGRFELLRRI